MGKKISVLKAKKLLSLPWTSKAGWDSGRKHVQHKNYTETRLTCMERWVCNDFGKNVETWKFARHGQMKNIWIGISVFCSLPLPSWIEIKWHPIFCCSCNVVTICSGLANVTHDAIMHVFMLFGFSCCERANCKTFLFVMFGIKKLTWFLFSLII